jgi:hypothetical protein
MKESLERLSFLNTHLSEFVKHFDKTKVKMPIGFFYLGLLERVNAGTVGLKQLIEVIDTKPEVELSAGLIARTLLLDFMIGLRGYDILEATGKSAAEKEQELIKYCNDTLADGVEYAGKDIKRLYEKGHHSQDEAEKFYSWLSEKFPAFVQPYRGDMIPPKSRFGKVATGSSLFDSISANPTIGRLAANYEKYSYYSKYEHFSAMSYEIMRVLKDEQIKTLANAITVLALHSYVCILMFSKFHTDDFITAKLKTLDDYCRQIIGAEGN